MSDNEFDAQRDRAEEAPDNLVLTGEEIELPGEDSDASAIIGESSEPIHTGEIEAVAIGMVGAAEISARLGLLSGEDRARIDALIHAMGLPCSAEGVSVGPWAQFRERARIFAVLVLPVPRGPVKR